MQKKRATVNRSSPPIRRRSPLATSRAARHVQPEASSRASAATILAWYLGEVSCCAEDWELSDSVPSVLDENQRAWFKVDVAFPQHDRQTPVDGVNAFIGESEDDDARAFSPSM